MIGSYTDDRTDPPSAARENVRAVLCGWGVDQDHAAVVLLVISELVTNSVEHAKPNGVLHLQRTGCGKRIIVSVTDGGPTGRKQRSPCCGHKEHGRGLAIVSALSLARGSRPHMDGKQTHWAEIAVATA